MQRDDASLASYGIAATLMEGGKTAHFAFNFPLNVRNQEFPVCNITKSSVRSQIFNTVQNYKYECTMAHRKSLEALNRTFKICGKNKGITSLKKNQHQLTK